MSDIIINGKRVGTYDYGAGLCLPAAPEKPTAAKPAPIKTAVKADPRAERSWWETLLFGGKTKGGAIACAGSENSDQQCGDKRPVSGIIEGPTPPSNYDLGDPERGEIEWKIFGITNCDGSTEGISVVADFGPDGGEIPASFESSSDGTLTAVIRHQISQRIGGEIPVTITAANGYEKLVSLYPPAYRTPDCYYGQSPTISAQIERAPSGDVYVEENVRFTIPLNSIRACDRITAAADPDRFTVAFIVDNQEREAQRDGSNYFVEHVFHEDGDKRVVLRVTDEEFTETFSEVYASLYVKKETTPLLAISGPYSAHYGDPIVLTASTDTEEAEFEWVPIPPEGEPPLPSSESSLSFTADYIGRYDVRVTVYSPNRSSSREALHNVDIYPSSTDIPTVSIRAPYSAHVNEDVTLVVVNPDHENLTYTVSWGEGDPVPLPEGSTLITHPYSEVGTYTMVVTVARRDDPTIRNAISQTVSVVPAFVAIPTIGISGPYSAHDGDLVTLSANSDVEGATFDWVLTPPEGEPITYPGQASITFTAGLIGRYDARVVVTAPDGTTQNQALHAVDVYPLSVDIPAVSMTAPYSARVNSDVTVTVPNPNPDYSYTIDWGDGRVDPGTSATHPYSTTGTYTIRVTATRIDDPSIHNSVTQSISIVPYEMPSVGIVAPFFGYVLTPVPFSVPNPTAGAVYSWNYGDGSPLGTGGSVSHPFSSIGEYQVRVTADLGGTTNSITHNITIGSTPVPMPAITAVHSPASGPGSGYNIVFNATGSYSPTGLAIPSYSINYGDGTPAASNATGIFSHTYPNPGAGNSSARTALLTITDSSGNTNSAYITISIWGD